MITANFFEIFIDKVHEFIFQTQLPKLTLTAHIAGRRLSYKSEDFKARTHIISQKHLQQNNGTMIHGPFSKPAEDSNPIRGVLIIADRERRACPFAGAGK